ncbi:monooxygenase [Coemansia sp. RSA 2559]|nr:monooxygenase [Coemansia sp. RSA 2559]KAJ2869431.1 monooxygenase [Coemansia erecta]
MKVAAHRIGVIGAGPAGLAVARVLASEPGMPFAVTVLERSNDIGGVWNYTPDPVCHYNVPQDSSKHAPTRGYDERSNTTGGFPTPMYDELYANLPKDVMQFPEFPFPKETPDFPNRKQIRQYVHRYYGDPKHKLKGLVQLNSQVESAEYKDNEWVCTVRRLANDGNRTETLKFDALAVCTGRVNHPYIPQVPGLHELAQARPGTVIHAKEYRRASDYTGMTVLIVGGASSGIDISRQLSFTARKVHLSVHIKEDDSLLSAGSNGWANKYNLPQCHPQIQSFSHGSVVFADGSNIGLPDRIIYATGYLSAYPFFEGNKQLEGLTDGRWVNDLYKYLLYTRNPTLAIFGIPAKIAPFPLFEYQATFFAKVMRGIVELPSTEAMQSEWDDLVRRSSSSHKMLYEFGMRQIEYQNELIDIISEQAKDKEPLRLGHVSEEWAERYKHKYELRMKILGY